MNTTTNRLLTVALAAGLLATGIWCAGAKSEPTPAGAALPEAPPLAEAAENSVPGLTLTFESKGVTDARSARLIALNVPAGTPATPFLPVGPFKATFEGFISQSLRGDFDFTASGNGTLAVSVNDKPVLSGKGDLSAIEAKRATLKKGKNKIVVTFESPDTGDAVLRLYWAVEGEFPAEPIDPKLFTHNTTAKPIAGGLRVREGRALFADLHCAKCHTDASLASLKDGMPELAKDAPNLDEVGARLNPAWIARWVSNPKALRPDTSMPNVFHGKAGTTVQEATDIAAYLASLGPAGAEVRDVTDNDKTASAAGGRLVARLGCIGCHTLGDKEIGADPQRVPWAYLKAKYKPLALVDFLKQPEKHYAWIRMPNFRLADDEAGQIAAYLLSTSKDFEGNAAGGDPAKGKQLIQSSGCVNCHGLKTDNTFKAPTLAEIPKDAWAKGCMAKDDTGRGKAPDFGFDDSSRDALLAFAATDRSSLTRDALSEFAERQVTELRCVACHNRDTKLDIWDDLVKETAALSKGDVFDPESSQNIKPPPGESIAGSGDQSRPPLTWVGEKLHPKWMATFIAGKLEYKPRTWMIARMPGFPARAELLAKGLALQHGFSAVTPESEKPEAELAEKGKKLVGRNGGFSCIQCHGIADISPIAPFEAPSINFKYARERLRKEYYDRWMRNPPRIVPTTKMPAFADQDGKTSLRDEDVFEGDAKKQFDSIWNYLMAGRKIEHPEQDQTPP